MTVLAVRGMHDEERGPVLAVPPLLQATRITEPLLSPTLLPRQLSVTFIE